MILVLGWALSLLIFYITDREILLHDTVKKLNMLMDTATSILSFLTVSCSKISLADMILR